MSVKRPLNSQQPQMGLFFEEVTNSVCFLIENRDHVPLFHLTFTQRATVSYCGGCKKGGPGRCLRIESLFFEIPINFVLRSDLTDFILNILGMTWVLE